MNTPLHVHKFGGAALASPENLQRVTRLLHDQPLPMVVVVSAMAKTTNRLEALADAATHNQPQQAHEALAQLRQFHFSFLDALFPENTHPAFGRVTALFDELDRIVQGILLLQDVPGRVFDRIMAFGELLSSVIVDEFLRSQGLPVHWLDARDLVLTDSHYGAAQVMLTPTFARLKEAVSPLLAQHRLVLLQGYIGRSTEGRTTTLGREGSDYTGALVAAALGAESLTVWKDVAGVFTADPKTRPDALHLPSLTYEQAVIMTFYGASVIHPKTLKPLQNAGIPLVVRSFLVPDKPGTRIGNAAGHPHAVSPALMHLTGRHLLVVQRHDLEFMNPETVLEVLQAVLKVGLEVEALNSFALQLALVLKPAEDRLGSLMAQLSDRFALQHTPNLQLDALLFAEPEHSPHPVLLSSAQPGLNLRLSPKALAPK